MYKILLLTIFILSSSNSIAGDVVDTLIGMNKQSEDFRELSIECYIEMKIWKAKGWDSEECNAYKVFAKSDLKIFRNFLKETSDDFKQFYKSNKQLKNRVRLGLKQLITIQSNMENIGTITKKIKVLLGR